MQTSNSIPSRPSLSFRLSNFICILFLSHTLNRDLRDYCQDVHLMASQLSQLYECNLSQSTTDDRSDRIMPSRLVGKSQAGRGGKSVFVELIAAVSQVEHENASFADVGRSASPLRRETFFFHFSASFSFYNAFVRSQSGVFCVSRHSTFCPDHFPVHHFATKRFHLERLPKTVHALFSVLNDLTCSFLDLLTFTKKEQMVSSITTGL